MSLTTTNGSDSVTELLMRAATDPSFDSQKFETAVAFVREREAKAERRAYNEAMARIAEKLDAVPKAGKNTHLRNKYATLDGMLAMVKPIASECGIGLRFGSQPASKPGYQCVTCITSLGAHEEITSLEGPSGKASTQMTEIQAVGSTTTYLKRYLLGMVFSLVLADEQDDDGEATRPKPPVQSASSNYQHPASSDRDRINAEVPLAGEQKPPHPLDAEHGPTWLANLERLLTEAPSMEDGIEVAGHPSVDKVLMSAAPQPIKDKINELLRAMHERFEAAVEEDELPEIVGEKFVGAG